VYGVEIVPSRKWKSRVFFPILPMCLSSFQSVRPIKMSGVFTRDLYELELGARETAAEIVFNSSGEIYCRAVRFARVYVLTALMHLCTCSRYGYTPTHRHAPNGKYGRSGRRRRCSNIIYNIVKHSAAAMSVV